MCWLEEESFTVDACEEEESFTVDACEEEDAVADAPRRINSVHGRQTDGVIFTVVDGVDVHLVTSRIHGEVDTTPRQTRCIW